MKEKTSNDENIRWNQVCSEKEIRFSQRTNKIPSVPRLKVLDKTPNMWTDVLGACSISSN